MAQLDFQLNEFLSGYFVCMTVTTQCADTVKVYLRQGSQTLLSVEKTDASSALKVVAQKNVDLRATGPSLTIEVPGAAKLSQSRVAGLISDDQAVRVGFIYDFCIETGNDQMMDDIYINLVGWERKN